MTVTVEGFRATFPAFADPGIYGEPAVQMYLNLSVSMINADRWDDNVIDYGTCLFVAHFLILDARDNAAAKAGGIAGAVQGVITDKAVDKVRVSYDAASVTLENGAGQWNMTRYGVQFLQLLRLYGTGGVQLGIGNVPGGIVGFWGGY